MTTPMVAAARRRLDEVLAGTPSPQQLNSALRHLAKWRAQMLENTLVQRSGDVVLSGPFKGMRYPVRASEGSRNARLVGCYEASLHPLIEKIIANGYKLVVDVGCAEGYYANGFALRMPKARILARDLDPQARLSCAAMATANGLEGRIEIGGLFAHADFAVCSGQKSLVLCDIEGAEGELLDPVAAPGLLRADILVEVHEGMRPGLVQLLAERFAPTHTITRYERRLVDTGLPDWTDTLGDLDRLLLLWEWRATPTPWLWLKRKPKA